MLSAIEFEQLERIVTVEIGMSALERTPPESDRIKRIVEAGIRLAPPSVVGIRNGFDLGRKAGSHLLPRRREIESSKGIDLRRRGDMRHNEQSYALEGVRRLPAPAPEALRRAGALDDRDENPFLLER